MSNHKSPNCWSSFTITPEIFSTENILGVLKSVPLPKWWQNLKNALTYVRREADKNIVFCGLIY